jgi:cobalt-zinc-cadmium resistance protein CzcA
VIGPVVAAGYHRRGLVIAGAVFIVGLGVWAFNSLQVEAYPDISGTSVQVIATYPGRATEEVERQVTVPIERAMGGVPRMEVVRSRTIFGLAIVQIGFEDGTELYWARQRVQERLGDVQLPKGADTALGPPVSSCGEVCRYELRSDGRQDVMGLRTLSDWVVTPRLLRVAGVGDVTVFGGLAKEYVVTLVPAQLQRYGLALADIVSAIQTNNSSAGGSTLTQGSMSFVIRGRGSLRDERDVGAIFVKSIGGTPVYLRDVAEIGLDHKVPSGIYSKDERDDTVEGIVTIRKGVNPSDSLVEIKAAIQELNDGPLAAEGARAEIIYDRSQLVDATFETVAHSIGLGIALVVVILLLFLGSPTLSTIVAATIPFSLLFALTCMYGAGIPIGLLSIGAIDFGIIVDGAVIVVDNIAHRLSVLRPGTDPKEVRRVVLRATLEVERPVFFAVLMIIGVQIPLLTLTRIEGLLFRPMALTIVFALIGALLFALFAVPVLVALLFSRGYKEWHNPLMRLLEPAYAWTIRRLLGVRWLVALLVGVALAGVVWYIAPRLGTEFLPYMDEGSIWVKSNFPDGCSLQQTSAFGGRLREIVRDEFPDIAFISVQAGRNDANTDPFPSNRMEIMIGPKPRKEWRQFQTKDELVTALGKRFRSEFPTNRFNFTQPIIDNVIEDTNGTSADLAVEISGDDAAVLRELAERTVELLRSVRGSQDVAVEQEGPQPQLVIEPDRQLCARYNVRVEDVNTIINTALGGEPVGTLYEGERQFNIVTKFDPSVSRSPAAVGRLPVFTADGIALPLSQVARIDVNDGQTIIGREGSRRRLTVRCDIRGRDQGGFVGEAQEKFEREIKLPPEYRVKWLGMFENLSRARKHFMIMIPVAGALVFAMLVITLGSARAALAVVLAVPFAVVGGVLALHLRGMNLNVSGGVGFAALLGVSIMNGVLMLQRVTDLRMNGLPLDDAVVRGARELLRAILMASLVAMLGLVPASMATGLGSDVQRPLATVIVWGLFSATAVTLFVVPVFYRLLNPPLPSTATD